jgi:hypothetical protein
MQTYPLDIEPEQVVRWIIAEHDAAPSPFKVAARRVNEVRQIPLRREFHLGDQEREDLSEVATIATLELAPGHAGEGWSLTVVVEDEAGSRVIESGAPGEREEGMDLRIFEREFMRQGRGIASVIAQVEDAAAEARMARLLSAIKANRHSPGVDSKC